MSNTFWRSASGYMQPALFFNTEDFEIYLMPDIARIRFNAECKQLK